MSSCAVQVFNGVTAEQFACLVGKAQAAGINIAGNSGSASERGITIAWTFDPVAKTLSVQCTSTPFGVMCGAINSKVHDLVDSCSG